MAWTRDIRKIFEEKVFSLLGQPPMSKPPKTLANEVVKKLFDGLAENNVSSDLLNLYYKWVDSENYSPSLVEYISRLSAERFAGSLGGAPRH